MKFNQAALEHAKALIKSGKYTTDGDWSEDQPATEEINRFIEKHGWGEYSKWYLGFDTDAKPERKGYYHFPYGDLKQVNRRGVIAAKQRAAQNDYRDIEKAADELLEMIDEREQQKS